jgi:hypothetical protein
VGGSSGTKGTVCGELNQAQTEDDLRPVMVKSPMNYPEDGLKSAIQCRWRLTLAPNLAKIGF